MANFTGAQQNLIYGQTATQNQQSLFTWIDKRVYKGKLVAFVSTSSGSDTGTAPVRTTGQLWPR